MLDDGHLVGLDGAEGRLLVRDGRLLAHLHEEHVRVRLLLLHDHGLLLEHDLHLGHLRRGTAQLDEAALEAHLHRIHLVARVLVQGLVELDELEVALGGRVHVAPLRG